MDSLENALRAWRGALGEEYVLTEPAVLAASETATFPTRQRIPALLRPGSTAEVQACLRIAQEHRVPLYPVSGGRNWGYGSRVPPTDGSVLMSLSRMDRVLGHDEQLGTLTVEPGVTFRQAHAWLEARGSSLFLTTIGGSPDGSLIGNALERGDGRGPTPDIFDHVCALEVVLPTGELVHTGHARFPGARAEPVFRWGLGPFVDGLFSQSNLGVVTRMTFWLNRKAPHFREFLATVESDEQLSQVVDRLQELSHEGTLRGSVFLWNDVKVLSVTQQYPWKEAGGRTPLPAWVLDKVREDFGRWGVTGALYSPDEAIGEATERRIRSRLEGLVRRIEFHEPEAGTSVMHGVPSEVNLAMGYWRKRTPQPSEPHLDRDRCGFIWSSVAVPFSGPEVTRALAIAARVPRLFALEPNLALLGLTPRCLYLVSALIYDREVPKEDERAMACYRALERELTAAGYYPTRAGLQDSPAALPQDEGTRALLRRLKEALDPNGILAPGRYGL
jgi:4-cresol dehydrogenase (hydroxylating)